jgi:hypothetical protein
MEGYDVFDAAWYCSDTPPSGLILTVSAEQEHGRPPALRIP